MSCIKQSVYMNRFCATSALQAQILLMLIEMYCFIGNSPIVCHYLSLIKFKNLKQKVMHTFN